jgi:hypothetical protein
MLIVQRIITEWTKASRGGTGAAKRNATPIALPLPPIHPSGSSYVLHDVQYQEDNEFAPRFSTQDLELAPHFLVEPLLIHVTKEQIELRFQWSWNYCGAPERESHDLFPLAIGNWGRFTCNGRFGATTHCGSDWFYRKTVFNIALMAQFDTKVFLETLPVADKSSLARLR